MIAEAADIVDVISDTPQLPLAIFITTSLRWYASHYYTLITDIDYCCHYIAIAIIAIHIDIDIGHYAIA